eukprot:jgi/Mesvir1/15086/Mv14728-RA.1
MVDATAPEDSGAPAADMETLYALCKNGDLAGMRNWLSSHEPSPEVLSSAVDASGYTCLALVDGHCDCALELLKRGADPRVPMRENKNTAFHFAAIGGHAEVLQRMLQHLASVTPTSNNTNTSSGSSPHVSDTLVNANGDTPLMFAAGKGHLAAVNCLLDSGLVPVTCKNRSGMTALMVAAGSGKVTCVRALLAHEHSDTHINATDLAGCSALHFAARGGHSGCAAALLSAGAQISRANARGKTALAEARMSRDALCIRVLETYQKNHNSPRGSVPTPSPFGAAEGDRASPENRTATASTALENGGHTHTCSASKGQRGPSKEGGGCPGAGGGRSTSSPPKSDSTSPRGHAGANPTNPNGHLGVHTMEASGDGRISPRGKQSPKGTMKPASRSGVVTQVPCNGYMNGGAALPYGHGHPGDHYHAARDHGSSARPDYPLPGSAASVGRDSDGEYAEDGWQRGAVMQLQREMPMLASLDVGVAHLLGQGLETLSMSQLEALEEAHRSQLDKVAHTKKLLSARQQALMAAERACLQREVEIACRGTDC